MHSNVLNPYALSDEELISILEQSDTRFEKSKKNSDIIQSFISVFKIEGGENIVSGRQLFALYQLWNPRHEITFRVFNARLRNYVPIHGPSGGIFYFNTNINSAKIEEILNTAIVKRRNKSRVVTKHHHNHISNFLTTTKIGKGKIHLEFPIVYYAYTRWCDDNRKRALNPKTFYEICKMHLDSKVVKKQYVIINYFSVNDEIYNIIKLEEIERWRDGKKEIQHKRNKRLNKKRKKQVPSIG